MLPQHPVLGRVQSIQTRPLAEDGRLGRIQVLRQRVVKRPPAEAQHPASHVEDREHHPVAKTVVVARRPLSRHHQSRGQQVLRRIPLATRQTQQEVPRLGHVSEPELLPRLLVQPSRREILPSRTTLLGVQKTPMKHLGRPKVDVEHGLASAVAFLDLHPTLQLDAGPARQVFHRLRKLQSLRRHHKAEYVSALPAAKAFEDLLARAHLETGRLFAVKRTQGLVIFPRPLQGNILLDDVDDVVGPTDLLYLLLAEKSCHRAPVSRPRSLFCALL